jgi:hypothetical protein
MNFQLFCDDFVFSIDVDNSYHLAPVLPVSDRSYFLHSLLVDHNSASWNSDEWNFHLVDTLPDHPALSRSDSPVPSTAVVVD